MVDASLPLRVSLEQLVSKADHIFVGHVFDVDMIDGEGEQIEDLDAMTGPGLDNKIRLLVKVEEIYTKQTTSIPKIVKIPLDSFMHFRFRQIKNSEKSNYGKKAVFLLSGNDFQPPVAGQFMRGMNLKNKILQLKNLQNKPIKKLLDSDSLETKKEIKSFEEKQAYKRHHISHHFGQLIHDKQQKTRQIE